MNLKKFKYVLTLADEHSFSRAADILNITQPSLSQYIKKIEREIGVALFDRINGDVRLTDAGRAYIGIGRKMMDLDHQLDQKISDIASFKSGTISIGISAHRSVALMPEVVRNYKKRYPGIIPKIIERQHHELIEAAEHGEFDVVVTTLPVDETLFNMELLFVEENVIAAPSPLPCQVMEGRKYPVIDASVLNNLSFVMLNDDHLMQRELEELIHTYNLKLHREVECTSLEALVEMVREGIGYAFIPACLARGELHFYSVSETVPKREIVAMYRKGQYLSQAVKELILVMHEVLREK